LSLTTKTSSYLNQNSGEKILLTLWVGALWSIGFLAVPILFGQLDDRQLAGMLAGKMFTAVSYIGLFCGSMLVISLLRRLSHWRVELIVWLLFVMLLLVVIGEFIIQPQMAELKLMGLLPGSETSQQFDLLHRIASTLYTINSILGLALVMLHQANSASQAQ
jgi:hypothetical protein